jgi:hypothetical protein
MALVITYKAVSNEARVFSQCLAFQATLSLLSMELMNLTNKTIYKCDTCGTTSDNPADILLQFFCAVCFGEE